MAPRKNVEKLQIKPLQATVKKGVKKRTITASAPTKRKPKILPNADPNVTINHASPQNSSSQETPKTRKTQRKKKSETNTNQDTTQNGVETTQHLTPKSKAKVTQKQKVSDIQVMLANEDTTQNGVETTEHLTPKSKAKVTQKQKVSDIQVMLANEDTTQNGVETTRHLTPKSKAKVTQKQKVSDIQVMLANEVVRNAFQKKPAKLINIDLSVTPPCIETVNTSKRGRPKKSTLKLYDYVLDSNAEPTNNLEHNKNIQDVAKKKVIKVINRKRPANVGAPAQEVKPQLETTPSDSPNSEGPKKRKRLSLKRKTTLNSPQNPTKRKQGKEESNEALLHVTPAIASDCPKLDSMPETNGHVKEPDKRHRKTSITSSSTSCLSWTKDISSSSTITCITVQSNDFVRMDNKLPIIKLTNIENNAKKQDISANTFEENSIDSHSKNQISDSSTISTGDLKVSQTLNLSTSSLTSVTTNTARNSVEALTNNARKNDATVKKLQESLDSLSSKMKHFDLEIINWIGYDDEVEDAKTIEYHARIFEVLKEENDIIKYCKQIKKVLTGGDSHSSVGVEDEPQKKTTISSEINVPSLLAPPVPKTSDKDVHNNNIENVANQDIENDNDIENAANDSSQGKEANLNQSDSGKKNNPTRDSVVEPTIDRCVDKSFQTDHTEDDDAISLFAESITGWETSKKSSTISKSIDTVDNEKVCTTAKLQGSTRFERVRPPSDTEDDLEKGRCVDVPNEVTNGISEERKADSGSFFKKFANKSIFNHIQTDVQNMYKNITDISSTSPFFSSFPNRFNLPNNMNKSAIAAESCSQFSEYHNSANSMNPNVSGNFRERFPDLKKFQIKVPASSSDNSNRRFEMAANTDGVLHNSAPNLDARTMNSGLENRTNQINETNIDQHRIENSSLLVVEPTKPQSPILTVNKQPAYRGSMVFNCCIFYAVSKCRKINCQFPHVSLSPETLSAKLKELSEQVFIKECMFLVSKTILMCRYGMCYVLECVRRNMTKLLLLITVDFIAKVNRTSFVVEVVEATLLHMNGVDFEPCMVILQCEVSANVLLCDYFMKVISETQNFSRFKVVFIKLAAYMCRIGRSFRLDVATQLLERVCILAYDDVLAAALIEIMQKTDVQIFAAPMMANLEVKLCGNNAQLYEQLISLKAKAGLGASPQSPRGAPTAPTASTASTASTAPHTSTPIPNIASPDTSTGDTTSNQSEPTITRTIFNHTANKNGTNMAHGSSDSSEDLMKTFELRRMPRWRNNLMRPQRKVFQRNWHPPRGYSGTPPRFRRPPPPPGC